MRGFWVVLALTMAIGNKIGHGAVATTRDPGCPISLQRHIAGEHELNGAIVG